MAFFVPPRILMVLLAVLCLGLDGRNLWPAFSPSHEPHLARADGDPSPAILRQAAAHGEILSRNEDPPRPGICGDAAFPARPGSLALPRLSPARAPACPVACSTGSDPSCRARAPPLSI